MKGSPRPDGETVMEAGDWHGLILMNRGQQHGLWGSGLHGSPGRKGSSRECGLGLPGTGHWAPFEACSWWDWLEIHMCSTKMFTGAFTTGFAPQLGAFGSCCFAWCHSNIHHVDRGLPWTSLASYGSIDQQCNQHVLQVGGGSTTGGRHALEEATVVQWGIRCGWDVTIMRAFSWPLRSSFQVFFGLLQTMWFSPFVTSRRGVSVQPCTNRLHQWSLSKDGLRKWKCERHALTQVFEFKTRIVSPDEKLSHNSMGPMVEWWFVSMTSSFFVTFEAGRHSWDLLSNPR